MIVFIVIAILGFIIGIVVTSFLFWFVSYIISSFFTLFAEKNKKVTQGLVQTVLLFIGTIFLFVYSFKSCNYVDRFGGNSDSMPVIGGWFLLLTGLITGCVTFFVFIFAFNESGEQKTTEIEKDSKPLKEIALETNELDLNSTDEVVFPTIMVGEFFESSNTNNNLLKAYPLKDLEENQAEILESEENLSEFEKKFYKIAKNKGVNFLKSPEYGFIQKSVVELKKGKDIDYNLIKSQIRHKWGFSTNQLFKFVSAEMDRQSSGYSFVQEYTRNSLINSYAKF